MSNDLNKSLYQAVAKALGSAQGKKHAAQHIVKDILDPNMQAETPKEHVPASAKNVLHKDQALSEMHDQKQAMAEAKLGMPPSKGPYKLRKFMEKCSMKKASKTGTVK
jgi:hypothetical protein